MTKLEKAIYYIAFCGFCISVGLSLRTWDTVEYESWIPQPHYSRLIEWGALDFVERNLTDIKAGDGWVEVITGVVYLDIDNSEWFTAALIHEASHVQQYKDGLQYYGSHAEAMADAVTKVFWDGWPQRHPDDVPDNGPVGNNPIVEKEK